MNLKKNFKFFTVIVIQILVFTVSLSFVLAAPSPTPTPSITPVPTPVIPSYGVNAIFDKTSVKDSDVFNFTFGIENRGAAPIQNLEIRVPFFKTIQDTEGVTEIPTFNRLLANGEYPQGLNDRAWIINTLNPGQSSVYKIQYKVVNAPKVTNGLISKFTVPSGWVDPRGLPQGSAQQLKYFRADVYIGGTYAQSYEVNLPTLTTIDNQISSITLNSMYLFAGSRTSNLKTVNSSNIAAFPNFILETEDILFEWQEPIDFSGADTATKLKQLDANFIPEWGKVSIKPDQLKFLDKPVKVTFKKTDFLSDPKIKVNAELTDLLSAKGTFNPSTKDVIVTLSNLKSLALSPVIDVEKSVVETSEEKIVLKAKTNNTRAKISYKVDAASPLEILAVDAQTGAFEVTIPNTKDVKQVELMSKIRNNEVGQKIVIVKYTPANITPTPQEESTRKTGSAFNPVTKILLMLAGAVFFILAAYLYFLYYRRKKNKALKDKIDLDVLTKRENLDESIASSGNEVKEHGPSSINLDSMKDFESLRRFEENKPGIHHVDSDDDTMSRLKKSYLKKESE